MFLQGAILSGWRAMRFIDGEGAEATKNTGKHAGQTLKWIAENDVLHLTWLVTKDFMQATMEALDVPYVVPYPTSPAAP